MSRHDLVSAQTSNVCIPHRAAIHVCVKQFVMPLPAMSLGDWFSISRKGRWVDIHTQRVKTVRLCVGLAVKIPQ